jgi:hypothetical protein
MINYFFLSLVNFNKSFFDYRGGEITWIGAVGFISRKDFVISISMDMTYNGYWVIGRNKTNGFEFKYIFLFNEFLIFPSNAKSFNPICSKDKLFWEVKPLNKTVMIDKIFNFINLHTKTEIDEN